ncbi:unnamed protein product [Zymoseptoria tritici ST99CH_1A5]|uniref:Uncharacterized protein n=1 Tax=Zymoseptoria tritici ST99CH_1A5 TaxID=1276529 RepID=A0A1Y6LM57_ZYMTR|nr:unnamed protein product [Zymoseptoria tritici ST99CH_1A5]
MPGTDYTVASVEALRGVSDYPTRPTRASVAAADFATPTKVAEKPKMGLKRSTGARRSVRFAASPPTLSSAKFTTTAGSRAESWDDPMITPRATTPPKNGVELLMPSRYSPPSSSDSGSTISESSSQESRYVSKPVRVVEIQYTLPTLEAGAEKRPVFVDSPVSGHKRNASSLSSRRGIPEDSFELFFTPIDVTKSQICLSSPTLPLSQAASLVDSDEEEDCLTPRPDVSRPASAIFVGNNARPKPNVSVDLTLSQLDSLTVALAKSTLIQRHVRKHWWDEEDIPEDDTIYSLNSVSTSSLPSSTAIPAPLFSMPNTSISIPSPSAISSLPPSRPLPTPPSSTKSTGPQQTNIALTDPKIHGSPIRYISPSYRLNNIPLPLGSATFLNVPHDTDVECTLRVEQPNNNHGRCKILLQTINQTVEKHSGKQIYLLAVDIDVTDIFLRATLAELASSAGVGVGDIALPSPTSPTPAPLPTIGSSASVDWLAVADSLLSTSESDAIVSDASHRMAKLTPDDCTMQTLALMSALERLKDQHADFLIIAPSTIKHRNGAPTGICVPWLSQRLWRDWFGKEEKRDKKFEGTRRAFEEDVIESVAKRCAKRQSGREEMKVKWGREELVVGAARLVGNGGEDVWVAFVRGEFGVLM